MISKISLNIMDRKTKLRCNRLRWWFPILTRCRTVTITITSLFCPWLKWWSWFTKSETCRINQLFMSAVLRRWEQKFVCSKFGVTSWSKRNQSPFETRMEWWITVWIVTVWDWYNATTIGRFNAMLHLSIICFQFEFLLKDLENPVSLVLWTRFCLFVFYAFPWNKIVQCEIDKTMYGGKPIT